MRSLLYAMLAALVCGQVARADDLNPAFFAALKHYAESAIAQGTEPGGCLVTAIAHMGRYIPNDMKVIPPEVFERVNKVLATIPLVDIRTNEPTGKHCPLFEIPPAAVVSVSGSKP